MGRAGGQIVVAGIDEAGYGPLLGPLVVAEVVFRVPTELAGADWWRQLRGAVASKPKVRDPRLVVTDSKELSRRPDGLRWLERTALAFLSLPDGQGNERRFPPTLRGLLGQIDRAVLSALDEYPWYRQTDFALPAANTDHDILTQRGALHASLGEVGMEFLGAYAEVLPEGHFNRLVAATRNKSVVLLGQTIRLIQRASEAAGSSSMHIFIDKQGGRQSYGRSLMTAFEDAHLEILEEMDTSSAYRLMRQPAPWEVRFVQGGEKQHLVIALASMYAKYVRELLMLTFNAFWSEHVQGLTHTAGYYTDGQRFVKDIEPVIERMKLDRSLLIRAR
jgi:ribonuclease HII